MKISTNFIAYAFLLIVGSADAFQLPARLIEIPQGSVTETRVPPILRVDSVIKTETRLRVGNTLDSDDMRVGEDSNLVPSGIFLLSAASLALLAFEIKAYDLPTTVGVWSLFWTTLAVGWDNFVIGLGKPFFSDVERNESKYEFLKTISYPRFTAHAVLVPFLYTTCGEIGKAMGVEWLQGDLTEKILLLAAAALGIISRIRFVNSEGIELADTSDSPPDAWERDLLWFTYVKPEFLYVVPAILLAIFEIVVGIQGFRVGNHNDAALWMIFAGISVLYGNSKPSYVTRFSGNIVEVIMLWSIFASASIVL